MSSMDVVIKDTEVSFIGNTTNMEMLEQSLVKDTMNSSYTTVKIQGNISTIQESCFSQKAFIKVVEITAPVTQLPGSAFEKCTSLTTITLPNELKTIGSKCFWLCASLASINLPETCKVLGSQCFFECSAFKTINALKVTSFGNACFQSCFALESMELNDTLTNLPGSLFENCYSLKAFNIPPLLKEIPQSMFAYCNSLTAITIPINTTTIQMRAFYYCYSLGTVTFQDGCLIESIGESAFKRTGISTLTLPKTIRTLSESAYSSCPLLTSVTWIDEEKSITNEIRFGSDVFSNCASLKTVKLTKWLSLIPQNTFVNCKSLEKYTITEEVENIGARAFEFCTGLGEVIVEKNESNIKYVSIDDYAFHYCPNLNFKGFNYLKSIGSYSFMESKLPESLVLTNKKLQEIGTQAFAYSTGVTSADVGVSISSGAFQSCLALAKVTFAGVSIPDSVCLDCRNLKTLEMLSNETFQIGSNAFRNCSSLGSLTFPECVRLSPGSFAFCSSIEKITFHSNQTKDGFEYRAFENCTKLAVYEIVDGKDLEISNIGLLQTKFTASSAYISFPQAKTLNELSLNSNYNIVEGCFAYCTQLNGIKLAGYGKELKITTKFCTHCYSVKSVTLADVTSIPSYAFEHCYALESFTIPNEVKTISQHMFDYCYKLSSIIIPVGIEILPIRFAQSCISLKAIVLPNSIKTISEFCFLSCISLSSITFSTSLISIGNNAFDNCIALEKVDLPFSIQIIAKEAFKRCPIKSVKIPKGVLSFAANAFDFTNVTISFEEGNKVYSVVNNAIIENGIKMIGMSGNVEEIYKVPDGIFSLAEGAFSNRKIRLITLPASMNSMNVIAFNSLYMGGELTEQCHTVPITICYPGNAVFDLSGIDETYFRFYVLPSYPVNEKVIHVATCPTVPDHPYSYTEADQQTIQSFKIAVITISVVLGVAVIGLSVALGFVLCKKRDDINKAGGFNSMN